MDALECIKTRRSIRKYQEKQVDMTALGNILDAGRMAPSAGNIQDWKFILTTEDSLKNKIAEACMQQYWIATAPAIITICSENKTEKQYGKDSKNYIMQNCAIVASQMMLSAHAQGLGTCYVSAFNEEQLCDVLGISGAKPFVVLPIGHPGEKPRAKLLQPIEHVTYVEKWGNRIKDINAWMGYYSYNVEKSIKQSKAMAANLIKKAFKRN